MASDYFKNQTMQDPAVPMIQLPIKFKSRRTQHGHHSKDNAGGLSHRCLRCRRVWVRAPHLVSLCGRATDRDHRRWSGNTSGGHAAQILLWYHARLDTLLCRQCSLHGPTQLRDTSDARQSGLQPLVAHPLQSILPDPALRGSPARRAGYGFTREYLHDDRLARV